jgi:unsaturated chondroitin disaccharide hydrolase
MISIDTGLTARDLEPQADELLALSAGKIRLLDRQWDPAKGTPVFTVRGRYASRGWTEWTQGFQYGCALYQFDATGDAEFLEMARRHIAARMASHVSHTGVHDHGFNNVSTYGNLLRLMREGRTPDDSWERSHHELALKVSGAVQAARWTALPDGLGFVYSFNGPHSLFADTIRSMRSLALADGLGHALMGERDRRISLLGRLLQHAETTARYNVYFGEGRDAFDERGRVAHEAIFNTNDGSFRCPGSQQGWSAYTTWTRGQAWILCGYAELLELFDGVDEPRVAAAGFAPLATRAAVQRRFAEVALAVADHYIAHSASCGVPYWDTGAPGLARMGDWGGRPADPFNRHEPVDSSAAAIAAQGLLRLGRWLAADGRRDEGARCFQAGLTVARTILADPYLSREPTHQGILLHSVYHRPNGWDHVAEGEVVPNGESSLWGDYHAMELAVYLKRLASGGPYLAFYGI